MKKVFIILVVLFHSGLIFGYDWPVGEEEDKQQIITTTFGEKRPSGTKIPTRFHEGVDIVPRNMTQTDNRDVYAIINWTANGKWKRDFCLTEKEKNSIDKKYEYIRIGKFRYVHIDIDDTIVRALRKERNDPPDKKYEYTFTHRGKIGVIRDYPSQNPADDINKTPGDHLHFDEYNCLDTDDGEPEEGNLLNSLRKDGLTPFTIKHPSGSTYPEIGTVEFYKNKVFKEVKEYDDIPLLSSGKYKTALNKNKLYGKVDILMYAKDSSIKEDGSHGTGRMGIYRGGYEILDSRKKQLYHFESFRFDKIKPQLGRKKNGKKDKTTHKYIRFIYADKSEKDSTPFPMWVTHHALLFNKGLKEVNLYWNTRQVT